MSRENPARYASPLFVKVIWKILAIFFWNQRNKTVALFAVMEFYQGTFYASFSSVSTGLSAESWSQ